MTASTEVTRNPSPNPESATPTTTADMAPASENVPPRYSELAEDQDDVSSNKALKRMHVRRASRTSMTGSAQSTTADGDRGNEDDRPHVRDSDWLVSDDAGMGFG